jgi:hypothetical protein
MHISRRISSLSRAAVRSYSWNSEYVQKKFEGAPILNVTDVEAVFYPSKPNIIDDTAMWFAKAFQPKPFVRPYMDDFDLVL